LLEKTSYLGFGAIAGIRSFTRTRISDVTQILQAIEHGDARTTDELLLLAYRELRRLAAHRMAGEASGHTFQPAALVREACLHFGGDVQPTWQNRAHNINSPNGSACFTLRCRGIIARRLEP
jgi:hypothetical protein